jgi:hypothetical protein
VNVQQGLGHLGGERQEPLALACGKNDDSHDA